MRASSPNYKYWAFGVIALGLFASVVDQDAVIVALPTIAGHFNTDLPAVQWVIIGYILTISALLLPMGRLADLAGRKKVYIVGGLVFVLGAAVAGRSTSLIMLILSRVVQGIGGAMTEGTGMAIITSVFPPTERGRAIGLIMLVVGLGVVAGPPIGGVLVDALGWPYVFFVNIPLILLGIATGLVILEGGRSPGYSQESGSQFDWLGAGLSTGVLVVLLLAMTNGHKSGWRFTSHPLSDAQLLRLALCLCMVGVADFKPYAEPKTLWSEDLLLWGYGGVLEFLGQLCGACFDAILPSRRPGFQSQGDGADHNGRCP